MLWNWQRSDWPKFTWDKPCLAKAEEQFLLGAGVIVGTVKHLAPEESEQLTVEAMSSEAVTTSEIEGEILNRASVQSSIRKQLGLGGGGRVKRAEQGVAEMMVDLYRTFREPLTEAKLRAWQRMLLQDRSDLRDIGMYRMGGEPMQVVSGAIHAPGVHFEAPPSASVPRETRRFVEWFNRCEPGGPEPLPALTRAGVAHLYFGGLCTRI